MDKNQGSLTNKRPSGKGWRSRVLVPLAIFVVYVASVALITSLTTAIAVPFQVSSASMAPSIQLNDRILVNRLIYKHSSIERGDIIAFYPPTAKSGAPYVKRAIGLPGDTVEVRDGQVLVNGVEFIVPGALQPTYSLPVNSIPDGMLFVLGDDRNQSSDSHIWGSVPVDDVIGRVDFVYWPLKNAASLSDHDVLFDLLIPVIFLIVILIMPVICAIVAAKRNRRMSGWFFLGLLGSIIPLPLAGILPLIVLLQLPGRSALNDIPKPASS